MRTIRSGWSVRAGVALAAVLGSVSVFLPIETGAASSVFTPQRRLGFAVGDQWEPAIAADDYGDIYVLYPQYDGVPGCPVTVCASPTAILQVSRDRFTSGLRTLGQ